MMRGSNSQSGERYVATANLSAVLAAQGRKQAWLAQRLGVSTSLLCLIIGGAKTVNRERGQQIADTLGMPFALLFKLHSRSKDIASESRDRSPAPTVTDPARSRLVVRQGDRQRILRPAGGARQTSATRPDTAGRSPPE
jgi:hypothetical protein